MWTQWVKQCPIPAPKPQNNLISTTEWTLKSREHSHLITSSFFQWICVSVWRYGKCWVNTNLGFGVDLKTRTNLINSYSAFLRTRVQCCVWFCSMMDLRFWLRVSLCSCFLWQPRLHSAHGWRGMQFHWTQCFPRPLTPKFNPLDTKS